MASECTVLCRSGSVGLISSVSVAVSAGSKVVVTASPFEESGTRYLISFSVEFELVPRNFSF